MKKLHTIIGLAVGALTTGCASIGPHAVSDAPVRPIGLRHVRTWEDVFAHPTALTITAYNTGEVLTGPRVLIDATDPKTPTGQKVEQWVPALGYLVRHPTEGAFLMDAGMPVADASGHCDFGIPVFFHAPCRAAAGQDLASQLRADHVDLASLRFILMSHLHGDHVGGLHALAAAGPVHLLLRREEWDAASRPMRMFDGYIHELLDGPYSVSYLPMDEAVTMPLVGTSLDLFGDGSVWVFPATGHTRGELAVLLNAQEGPLLFTFDSSHLRENFQSGIAPGFTVDRDAARSALARLAALRHAFPAMHVIYGHEPTQWAQLPRRVPLTGVPFPLSD